MARRRRAIDMVEALIMGAAIRPRLPDVKFFHVIPGRERSERTPVRYCALENLEIPGSKLRIAPE
jgi:hypothetical protein